MSLVSTDSRPCPSCLEPRNEADFPSTNPRAHCRPCKSSASGARYRRWASENRDRVNAAARTYRARRYAEHGEWRDAGPKAALMREWMIELKSKPCADCGGRFAVCCMDFDHRPGTAKSHNVGSMFAHHYGRELIEAEVAKCDLVCANCHRIRTRDRRRGSGGAS